MITPTEVRFIKLGGGGEWEQACIEGDRPCIRLGFVNPHHEDCLKGNWNPVRKFWARHKSKGKATEYTNQIKDFYTLGEDTLWITFYKRKLFWCFASKKIVIYKDGTRARRVLGSWKSTSILGKDLFIENLSGKLTKTQGFRGTICSVREAEYLIRRINGEVSPEVLVAKDALSALEQSLAELISSLGWKDFELLCDLIFTNAGWQRIARLGGTEKTVDLDLLSPVSGKKAFVQIKSQATKETLKEYCDSFVTMDQYDEMYFVVHSPIGDISSWTAPKRAIIISINELSRLSVSAGLANWIMQKNA